MYTTLLLPPLNFATFAIHLTSHCSNPWLSSDIATICRYQQQQCMEKEWPIKRVYVGFILSWEGLLVSDAIAILLSASTIKDDSFVQTVIEITWTESRSGMREGLVGCGGWWGTIVVISAINHVDNERRVDKDGRGWWSRDLKFYGPFLEGGGISGWLVILGFDSSGLWMSESVHLLETEGKLCEIRFLG